MSLTCAWVLAHPHYPAGALPDHLAHDVLPQPPQAAAGDVSYNEQLQHGAVGAPAAAGPAAAATVSAAGSRSCGCAAADVAAAAGSRTVTAHACSAAIGRHGEPTAAYCAGVVCNAAGLASITAPWLVLLLLLLPLHLQVPAAAATATPVTW